MHIAAWCVDAIAEEPPSASMRNPDTSTAARIANASKRGIETVRNTRHAAALLDEGNGARSCLHDTRFRRLLKTRGRGAEVRRRS